MAVLEIFAPRLLDQLGAAWTTDPALALAVATQLARASREPARDVGSERALLARFGHACGPADALPLAALTAAHDLGDAAAQGDILRLDPVHLRADPSRLILFDAATIGVPAAEADALLALVAPLAAARGYELLRGAAPARWYLRGSGLGTLRLPSPTELNGGPIEGCLAALRHHGELSRLLTEMQMVLHEALVNRDREAAGRAPVNSLWPWGGGVLPAPSGDVPAVVVGADDFAAACARHAGSALRDDLVAELAAPPRLALVIAPADLASCRETVLEPARAALAAGRLATVRLYTRALTFTLGRGDRWRLWRRPQAFFDAAMAALEAAPRA